jgi:hypothetical protein
MNRNQSGEKPVIDPGMTILDVLSKYRQTESVFKQYDEMAGVCLCCQALFEPLKDVAQKYGLDLRQLTADLTAAATSLACVYSNDFCMGKRATQDLGMQHSRKPDIGSVEGPPSHFGKAVSTPHSLTYNPVFLAHGGVLLTSLHGPKPTIEFRSHVHNPNLKGFSIKFNKV